jgi:hypothetical protein
MAATSIAGFFFHSASFGAAYVIGMISIVVLSIVLFAFKVRDLAGIWRPIYAVTATVALYLNAFVGVVQAFQKLSVLKEVAPTQTESPFLAAQALLLIAFTIVGFVAVRRLPRSQALRKAACARGKPAAPKAERALIPTYECSIDRAHTY